MKSTAITLSPDMKARLAVGHNQGLQAVANWDLPTLAGAGALRSTANDMLNFLAANFGYTKSPLAPAMAAMLQRAARPACRMRRLLSPGTSQRATARRSSGTTAARADIDRISGSIRRRRIGVVALSNTFTAAGVDDIGQHLLDTSVSAVLLRSHTQKSLSILSSSMATWAFTNWRRISF